MVLKENIVETSDGKARRARGTTERFKHRWPSLGIFASRRAVAPHPQMSDEYICLLVWFSVVVTPSQYYVLSIGYQLEQKGDDAGDYTRRSR